MVVTREWKLTPFQVRSDAQSVTVLTEALQVAVNRQSGAVEFLDSTGRPLLREPAGGGKAMTATTIGGTPSYIVGQTFVSPADEALFGLGQFQDGLWNWRGIPLELRQLNTQISLPVLISSKGFGLFWDNASITDFNSPGTAVSLVPEGGPAASDAHGPTATEQLTASKDGAGGKGAFRGTFVTGKAGEYVFCTRDGDRRGENSIRLDGA
jgi:alpha-D-xyloside xylohydrolase